MSTTPRVQNTITGLTVTPWCMSSAALTDLVERVALLEPLERQLPLGVQRDQLRDERRRVRVAHRDPAQHLPGEDPLDVDGDLGPGRRGAAHEHRAAHRGGIERPARDLRVARRVEAQADAATAGQLGEPLGDVLGAGVDRRRRAELLARAASRSSTMSIAMSWDGFALRRRDDRRQPDGAGAVDRDDVALAGIEHVPHRPETGEHPAAERGEHREVGSGVDLHDRALVGDRVLGRTTTGRRSGSRRRSPSARDIRRPSERSIPSRFRGSQVSQ